MSIQIKHRPYTVVPCVGKRVVRLHMPNKMTLYIRSAKALVACGYTATNNLIESDGYGVYYVDYVVPYGTTKAAFTVTLRRSVNTM